MIDPHSKKHRPEYQWPYTEKNVRATALGVVALLALAAILGS